MQSNGDVFLEVIQVGQALEVRAVDAATGLEVAFAAPLRTDRASMERLALQKLAYVQRKRQGEGGGRPGPKRDRPGLTV